MTTVDYFRQRNYILRQVTAIRPDLRNADIDELLNSYGYPCPRGTWSRFRGSGVPTSHFVFTLARVIGCPVETLCPVQWLRDLETCRNPRCDHGQTPV